MYNESDSLTLAASEKNYRYKTKMLYTVIIISLCFVSAVIIAYFICS